jgi:hypothetical protein
MYTFIVYYNAAPGVLFGGCPTIDMAHRATPVSLPFGGRRNI